METFGWACSSRMPVAGPLRRATRGLDAATRHPGFKAPSKRVPRQWRTCRCHWPR